MPNTRRPSSVDGIKRLAKTIKVEHHIRHSEALDAASKQAGYQGFAHARRRLESAAKPEVVADSTPKRQLQNPRVGRDAFLEGCRLAWVRALDQLNPGGLTRLSWSGPASIMRVLNSVLAGTRSHTHLPTGGGQDFSGVRMSIERGCLEFKIGENSAYVARPNVLILENFPMAPAESFLLLELDDLEPSGVYVESEVDLAHSRIDRRQRQEEVVELTPGEYVERGIWDEGNLGYDGGGNEIPLPDEARLIVRWLNGKMLFVTKGSMWNGTPSTYDGRHDAMTADEIRAIIDRSLQRRVAE